MKLILGIIFSLFLVVSVSTVYSQTDAIPIWIKGVAGFWAEGKITDSEFIEALEFLADNGIITVDGDLHERYDNLREKHIDLKKQANSGNGTAVQELKNENAKLKKQTESSESKIVELTQKIISLESADSTGSYANTEWSVGWFNFEMLGLLKVYSDINISKDNCNGWNCDMIGKDEYVLYISYENSDRMESHTPPDFCIKNIRLLTDKGLVWRPDYVSYHCQYNIVSDMRDPLEKIIISTLVFFTLDSDELPSTLLFDAPCAGEYTDLSYVAVRESYGCDPHSIVPEIIATMSADHYNLEDGWAWPDRFDSESGKLIKNRP